LNEVSNLQHLGERLGDSRQAQQRALQTLPVRERASVLDSRGSGSKRIQYQARKHQQIIQDFVMNHPRCGIWASMGLGKTAALLSAIQEILKTQATSVLVIAPLRVAKTTWPDELAKWDHLSLTMQVITGTPQERREALAQPASIYTINYENLPWLVEHLGEHWPFGIVVADESTRLKGYRLRQGTKRAQALASIAHSKCKRFIELTGTPSPNGLQDLWGQAWFIDGGIRLGRSFSAFTDRWFRLKYDGYGLEPLAHSQGEIQERLKDVCLSLNAKDFFDINDPIVNVIKVKLPELAMRQYAAMAKEMYLSIQGAGIEAHNAASKTIKCLQLASGAIYTDDKGSWSEIHDEKLQALESVIEEAAGASVLVAYHFKSDLERLQKRFPKGRVLDSNPQTIKAWNEGQIELLFAHPASAGHGLNLQDGGNILVVFSHWWDLEQFQQMVERIGPMRQKQSGHERPVFIHHIVAAGTVDELVMKRRETKREVQDLLLEALKYEVAP